MAIKMIDESRLGIGRRRRGFHFNIVSFEEKRKTSGGLITNTISAGNNHLVAIREDGTVFAGGCDTNNQVSDTQDWTNMISISAGGRATIGLDKDFNVKVAGDGVVELDAINAWPKVVDVKATQTTIYGMTSDGEIFSVNNPTYGGTMCQADVSCVTGCGGCAEKGLTGGCASSCASSAVCVKTDGTLSTSFYDDGYDFCSGKVPSVDWTDIEKVSTSNHATAGLKSDGTVLIATQKLTDTEKAAIESWTNIVDIVVASSTAILGLKDDGTLVVEGADIINSVDKSSIESLENVVSMDLSTKGNYECNMIALMDSGEARIWSSWDAINGTHSSIMLPQAI